MPGREIGTREQYQADHRDHGHAEAGHDRVGAITPMTLPVSIALLLAALAVLSLVPSGIVPWVIYGDDVGAIMQRRLLPVAIVVLPALGFLRLLLERTGRGTEPMRPSGPSTRTWRSV